jgi:type I restriction enzyme M protein
MADSFQASLIPFIQDDKLLLPKGISLRPEMISRMIREEDNPIRRLLFALFIRLLAEYNYREEQIMLDVPLGSKNIADLVVYRDSKHEEPFIVVRLDDVQIDELIGQVSRILKEIRPEYCVLGNLNTIQLLKVQSDELVKIEDIPFWLGNKPTRNRLPKTKILPPFRDEHSLKRVIYRCHTILYENLGHDPSKAFDELIKIIFLKFLDEQSNEDYYRFLVIEGERPEDVGKRMRDLLENAKHTSFFSKVFGSNNLELEVNDFALYEIVLELQGFSFTQTIGTISGIDIIGRIYEQIVDRTFRGGLGQYYTPRTIAEFMVDFLDVNFEDRVLDPACGTGGFLTMCLNRVFSKLKSGIHNSRSNDTLVNQLRNYIDSKLYGVDIFDKVCRVARMNLLLHGGSDPKIFNANGLLIDETKPEGSNGIFRDNSFQKILSNPPFAGTVRDASILSRFTLGKKNGRVRSVTPEVLFIEKIINLLDYNGKAGLVLPLGVFNNPSLKDVRDFLFRKTKILGVVGLPDFAFTHTGTSVKGALLFFEKPFVLERNYKIFMAVANNIGYDSTGRAIDLNDFPKLIEAYKNKDPNYFVEFSEIKDRIDAHYYLSYYKNLEQRIKKAPYPIKAIYDVIELSNKTVNPKNNPEKEFRYIETNCVDLNEGKIVKVKRFTGRKAPSRAKYVGREGDLLIPTAKESLIGVLLLPKKYDGVIVSSRFIVCRPREDIVHPLYLYYILKNKTILELLKRECVGEIVPSISEFSLKNVYIPVPPLEVQDKIVKQLREIEKRIEQLESEVRGLKNHAGDIIAEALGLPTTLTS